MFSSGYLGYMVIAGLMSLIGMAVSGRLKSKFAHYSQIPNGNRISGREVAQQMLANYGIHDVKIVESQGMLSDHYNPMNKTVALSSDVYHGRSVAAMAVAAHECGHAVQHATAYPMLKLRSGIVPLVKVSAQLQQWLLLFALGGFGAGFSGSNTLIMITIVAFAITALFSFITLPVEFDASKRALVWMDQTGTASGAEYEGARDALKWAAMTYVAAALSALVMLLYLITRLRD
ncbi:MAG: zinc metallopeptidase [Saprospiraceae bacterium]|nr:zinc metallopeptidase [Saprospiraceae bacterium]